MRVTIMSSSWRGESSCEACLHSDVRGLRPFAAANLWSIGLHARDLDAAVGAHNGEAVGVDRGDLAIFAADALGVFRRDRLGVENLHRLAVERRPGAGRRIAAADEWIDLPPGLAPVDAGYVGGGAGLVVPLA